MLAEFKTRGVADPAWGEGQVMKPSHQVALDPHARSAELVQAPGARFGDTG
jgi:hypothetical protein